jgi:ribosomal protein S9
VKRSVTTTLPDIYLKDVGRKKSGVSAAEAFEQVFAALHEKIISPVVAQALNEQLEELGLDINVMGGGTQKQLEAVGKGAQKELEAVTDKVKGLLGK